MTREWMVVGLAGALTMAIKAAGPCALGSRELPPALSRILRLLANQAHPETTLVRLLRIIEMIGGRTVYLALLAEITRRGAEIGIHGYVHNDYRYLSTSEQYKQTEQATLLFKNTQIPYQGFRNPYLGWTEESLQVV